MKQVLLRKGNKYKTAWIPAKHAIKDKVLRIRRDNGWIVDTVYSVTLQSDYLNKLSEQHKNTRKASDV